MRPHLGGIIEYTGALQALLLGFSPSNLPACPGCLLDTSIDAMLPPRLAQALVDD